MRIDRLCRDAALVLGLGLGIALAAPCRRPAWAGQPVDSPQQGLAQRAQDLRTQGQREQLAGQTESALNSFSQALTLARQARARKLEGMLLNNLGLLNDETGKSLLSISFFQQALEIARELNDPEGESTVQNNIGNAFVNLGKVDQAMERFGQSLTIARRKKNLRAEGITLNNISNFYLNAGIPEQALVNLQAALKLHRIAANRRHEGTTLNNIAAAFSQLGNYEAALSEYRKALAIARSEGDYSLEWTILANMAAVLSDLGKPEEALDLFEQRLAAARSMRDRSGEAGAFNSLGVVYLQLDRASDALAAFEKALAIVRAEGYRREEGTTLGNIGLVYSRMAQPAQALMRHQQALVIAREVKNPSGEGAALHNMAFAYAELGQNDLAIKHYRQALAIMRELKDVSSEATTLAVLSVLQRDQGQYPEAIANLQGSLSIRLNTRRTLQRKDRQAFLNQFQADANALVGLLIEQGRSADAFRWLNVFGSADLADYTRLIDAQLSDPQTEAALSQWRHRQQALAALRQQLQVSADSVRLQRLVEQEAAQQQQAEALITRYPQIAELLETRPADLQRLQAGIPDGTVVLQPGLLTTVPKRTDTVALFVLTRTSLQVVSVPLPANFNQQLEAYRQMLEDNQLYLEQSQQLYDLLIRPLEDKGLLPTGSRLALITIGKLRQIPFETLNDSRTDQYLIEKLPIHYLTRLSRTAAPASQTTGARSGGASAGPRRALVLANPTPTRVSLAGTEAEATYLVGAYPGSLELRRAQATLSAFQQQASRYPILHLGTHGCFIPGGCPSLGMEANTLLFANGVQYPIAQAARLGLSNTELLVLAACQTARLTDDSDMGLSGLAYVWERAGARSVVASLWSAPDKESSQLNQAFYANLKAGMDKADAMRQAKLALLRSAPDGLHPNAWAPFILIGDAAPLGR